MNDAAEVILQGIRQRSDTWRTGLATKIAGSRDVADAAVGLGDVISKIPNMISEKADQDEQAQVDHAFSGEMLRSGDAIKATDAALAVPVRRHGAAAKQAALAHGRYQLQMNQQTLQHEATANEMNALALKTAKGDEAAWNEAGTPMSPGSVDLEGVGYAGMPGSMSGGMDLPAQAPTSDERVQRYMGDPRAARAPVMQAHEYFLGKKQLADAAKQRADTADADREQKAAAATEANATRRAGVVAELQKAFMGFVGKSAQTTAYRNRTAVESADSGAALAEKKTRDEADIARMQAATQTAQELAAVREQALPAGIRANMLTRIASDLSRQLEKGQQVKMAYIRAGEKDLAAGVDAVNGTLKTAFDGVKSELDTIGSEMAAVQTDAAERAKSVKGGKKAAAPAPAGWVRQPDGTLKKAQ